MFKLGFIHPPTQNPAVLNPAIIYSKQEAAVIEWLTGVSLGISNANDR